MPPHQASIKRVCIVQGVIKGYRLTFFEQLDAELARHGVQLQVVYGQPLAAEALRGDNADLPPPLGCKVASLALPGGKGLLQATVLPWMRADLVIVEHANKHLLNWVLLLLRFFGLKRLAFWGHGRDSQADPQSRGERLKRRTLYWVDWWFAYTAGAAAYVAQQGFDPARITAVGNAIDTRTLANELASIGDDELASRRAQLDLSASDPVAVYCGSLYANKRLDILFDAADLLHAQNGRFKLLILGGGPLQDDVKTFCEGRPWAHQLGPLFGRSKALHLKLAQLWLNPGALGLGILDAFVAGLPMITTTNPGHGPEIEYLRHGHNGLILPAEAAAFASSVAALLADPLKLAQMRTAAVQDARSYSIEAMVENYARGVRSALGLQ